MSAAEEHVGGSDQEDSIDDMDINADPDDYIDDSEVANDVRNPEQVEYVY